MCWLEGTFEIHEVSPMGPDEQKFLGHPRQTKPDASQAAKEYVSSSSMYYLTHRGYQYLKLQ